MEKFKNTDEKAKLTKDSLYGYDPEQQKEREALMDYEKRVGVSVLAAKVSHEIFSNLSALTKVDLIKATKDEDLFMRLSDNDWQSIFSFGKEKALELSGLFKESNPTLSKLIMSKALSLSHEVIAAHVARDIAKVFPDEVNNLLDQFLSEDDSLYEAAIVASALVDTRLEDAKKIFGKFIKDEDYYEGNYDDGESPVCLLAVALAPKDGKLAKKAIAFLNDNDGFGKSGLVATELVSFSPQTAKKVIEDTFNSTNYDYDMVPDSVLNLVAALSKKYPKFVGEKINQLINNGNCHPELRIVGRSLAESNPEMALKIVDKLLKNMGSDPDASDDIFEDIAEISQSLALKYPVEMLKVMSRLVKDGALICAAGIASKLADKYPEKALSVFKSIKESGLVDLLHENIVDLALSLRSYKKEPIEFLLQMMQNPAHGSYYLHRAAFCASLLGDSVLVNTILTNVPDNSLKARVITSINAAIGLGKKLEMPDIKDRLSLLKKAVSSNDRDLIISMGAFMSDAKEREDIIKDGGFSEYVVSLLDLGLARANSAGAMESLSKPYYEKLKNLLSSSSPDDKTMFRIVNDILLALNDKEINRLLISVAKETKVENLNLARLLRTLALLDRNNGSLVITRFLGQKGLPEHLFVYFTKVLITSGYLTKNLSKFIDDQNTWSFIKRLFAEYPNQLNTAIDTLSSTEVSGELPSLFSKMGEYEEVIIDGLKNFGTITPRIFARYLSLKGEARKEFVKRMAALKMKFFKNIPIKNILAPADKDILSEMVYLAYQPINMSFEEVKTLLSSIDDQTEQLSELKFPEDGYVVDLSTKKYKLKKGESLDYKGLSSYKDIFTGDFEKLLPEISKILIQIAKAGTDFKPGELKSVFSLLKESDEVSNILERFVEVNEGNAFGYLTALKQILFAATSLLEDPLESLFYNNDEIKFKLSGILSNKDRLEKIKQKLSKDNTDIDFNSFYPNDEGHLAKLLSVFIGAKVLKPLKDEISKNLKKFEETKEGGASTGTSGSFRLYVSKNAGSFFAKASAGICTGKDMELFNNENHLHFNLVENGEKIRGNVQGFIIEEKNEKGQHVRSLVLRGFNPNEDLLKTLDPGSFAEEMIRIGRQFAKENGLYKVYITENLDNWHAISNRPAVFQYLMPKYCLPQKEKSFSLQVRTGYESKYVNKIYEI